MARTKDPHAATVKAWETRGRARPGGGSGATQRRDDWKKKVTSADVAADGTEFPETKDYARFREEIARHPLSQFTTPLTEEELSKRRVFLSEDGKTGYTLTDDDDLGNVFNMPGEERRGRGSRAVIEAVARGAKTLDCYDDVLPDYYQRHGFVPVARVKWDDKYAPPNWDYARFGRPDVVFMRYEGGDRRTLRERVGTFSMKEVKSVPRVDSYEAGQAAARREA